MSDIIKVSFGMLTYNQAPYVREAIESIFAQTYPIDEFIISDDCSTDGTYENVLEAVAACQARPNQIRQCIVRRHERNLGLIPNFNQLIESFANEFIIGNAGDDISVPDRVETIVREYELAGRPRYFLCHSPVQIMGTGSMWIPPIEQTPMSIEQIAVTLALHIGATQAFTRSLFMDFGPIVHDTYEDLVLGFRAALTDAYHYIDKPLMHYRPGGLSSPNGAAANPERGRKHMKETLAQRALDAFQVGRLDLIELLWRHYERAGFGLATGQGSEIQTNPQAPDPGQNFYSIYRERLAGLASVPTPAAETGDQTSFEFIVPCTTADRSRLADTLDSLVKQSSPWWRLTVVADFPAPDPAWQDLHVLKWLHVTEGDSLNESLKNQAMESDSQWLCVTEPGIRLCSHAVQHLAQSVRANPDWRLIYADSDHVNDQDQRHAANFRPDFNLDLLRSSPYLGECVWVERSAFAAAQGWTINEAKSYDLTLRVLDVLGDSVIGHTDDVLYHAPEPPLSFSEDAQTQALVQHLERNQLNGFISPGTEPGCLRVTYVHSGHPKVSILIATKDQVSLLRECLDSIFEKTTYPDFEVIVVDNQSKLPGTQAYLSEAQEMHAGRFKVLKYPKAFNHSAIRNLAAKAAAGEYLLFLDNDTQVLQKEWLHLLMYQAQRPDIGIVGPRLVYPGVPARIQHAGIVLGLGGVADHPYMGLLGLTDPGYMNRAQVDQDLSAVCGSCLLIRKSVFDDVGGLDESVFRNVLSPIDLCLKVRERGYKVLWTPHVTLVHHGSATRNAEARHAAKAKEAQENLKAEYDGMLRKWLPQLARDPAYNRHLSLLHRDYRVESDFVVGWDPRIPSGRTRILGWTLDGAPCEYRVKIPLQALTEAGATETALIYPPGPGLIRSLLLTEIVRAQPHIFTSSVFLGMHEHMETLKQIKRHTEIPIVLQLDDITTAVPKGSHAYSQRQTPGVLKKILAQADRVVASTPYIADFVKGLCGDVMLIPNYLPHSLWDGLTSKRRQGTKPRVGWAGAMQHGGDLALITEVVKATAAEVDWVFFGMCPEELTPFVREFHPFGPFEEYPAKLAGLNLDLAVAPLEDNQFNEGKSNLRLLEYGFLGWPVVCSDVLPYRNAPVKRVPNKPETWIEAIRERVHDLDAAEREGDELQRWVLASWMLEDHLDEWAKAYSFGV